MHRSSFGVANAQLRLGVLRRHLVAGTAHLPRKTLAAAATSAGMASWSENIITDAASAIKIAGEAKRVAVLGCQVEAKADRPAFYVPKALHDAGVDVIPVPTYYPEVETILGKQVYRRVADIPGGPVDIVDVFRRPQDLEQHADDLLAAKPRCVWLQSGISERAFEERLAEAGIRVVVSRCLMVDRRAAEPWA